MEQAAAAVLAVAVLAVAVLAVTGELSGYFKRLSLILKNANPDEILMTLKHFIHSSESQFSQPGRQSCL